MERKTKTMIILSAAILAVLLGIAAMVYANGAANGTTLKSDVMHDYGESYNRASEFLGGRSGGHGHECGPGGLTTVSQEYKNNVISIAQNDSDVQSLLANGYNVTDVRPIISTTVEGDGTVTMKATTAIVALCKDTTGRAFVTVNVEEGKVTEIVILTRTVIDKS